MFIFRVTRIYLIRSSEERSITWTQRQAAQNSGRLRFCLEGNCSVSMPLSPLSFCVIHAFNGNNAGFLVFK